MPSSDLHTQTLKRKGSYLNCLWTVVTFASIFQYPVKIWPAQANQEAHPEHNKQGRLSRFICWPAVACSWSNLCKRMFLFYFVIFPSFSHSPWFSSNLCTTLNLTLISKSPLFPNILKLILPFDLFSPIL